jgi:hypothetical protein
VLIDALRVVRGSARDLALPRRDSEEFKFLARRVYKTGDDAEIEERLAREVERYMGDVRAMAEKAVTSNQLSVTGY